MPSSAEAPAAKATGSPPADVASSPEDVPPCAGPRIEDFRVTTDVFRSFKARQVLYQSVAADAPLLRAYKRLVLEVVLPKLAAFCDEAGVAAAHFHYQYPPTMRLQPGPSATHGRAHRDAEYGHQPGEVNLWMPLSSYALTETTLRVESTPGEGDFHPLEVEYGEIACFHGALRHHYAPPNASKYLRASLDFRIGVGDCFDPSWVLPGVKALHSWMRVERSCLSG